MSLEAAAVALMIGSLAPRLDVDTRDRYAADIVAAAAGDDSMALALTTVQWEESHFEVRIEQCRCNLPKECDGGAAYAAPQIHNHWFDGHSAAEVCASNTLAMALAAKALDVLRKRTGTIRRALVAYIGCKATDIRARRRVALYGRLLAVARKAGAA